MSACNARLTDSPAQTTPIETEVTDSGTGESAYEADVVAPVPKAEPPHAWATGSSCDPATEPGWRPMTSAAALGVSPWVDGAVWSGTEMIAAGETTCHTAPCDKVVVAYSPATDTWRIAAKIPGPQIGGAFFSLGGKNVARFDYMAGRSWTWRGKEYADVETFDHGGSCVTYGAAVAYAPDTDELIAFGGGYEDDGPTFVPCAEGFAVHGHTTRKLAPPPVGWRGGHASAIWTGDSMLVFSWNDRRIARYEPDADRWTDLGAMPMLAGRDGPIALAQFGSRVSFYGGGAYDGDEFTFVATDGATYDHEASTWSIISREPETPRGDGWRDDPAWWLQPGPSGTGEIGFFGGYGYDHDSLLADIIAVDMTTGTWRTVAPEGSVLGPRSKAMAVWDDCETIVYGGRAGAPMIDGAIFKP